MRSWNGWQVISADLLERLPEVPGVFELGTLVRSVLYIGAAGHGIQSEVRRALAQGLQLRAHCVRFEAHADPVRAATEKLRKYRQSHGGDLPPAQPADLLPALVSSATATPNGTAMHPGQGTPLVGGAGSRAKVRTVFLRVASSA